MIVAHALVRAAPALVPTLLKCARMCRDESRHGTQEWSACATISAIQTITKGVARTIGAKLSDIAQECVPRRHLCRRSDSFRAGCRPLPLCKRLLVMTRVARARSVVLTERGVIIVALLGLCVGFLAAAGDRYQVDTCLRYYVSGRPNRSWRRKTIRYGHRGVRSRALQRSSLRATSVRLGSDYKHPGGSHRSVVSQDNGSTRVTKKAGCVPGGDCTVGGQRFARRIGNSLLPGSKFLPRSFGMHPNVAAVEHHSNLFRHEREKPPT